MLKTLLTIGSLQVLAILGSFIRSKTIAVLLGPDGVGIISNIDQLIQFASYASACSIPVASVKYLSKSHSEGVVAFQRGYAAFLNALLVLSVGGMLVTAAIVTFAPGLLGRELAQARLYVLVALPAVPAMSLGGYFVNVLAAAQRPTASSVMAIVTSLMMTVATCSGILLDRIQGMYIANSIALILTTVFILFYLRKTLDLPIYNPTGNIVAEIKINRGIPVFAGTLYISTFASSFALLVARTSVLNLFGAAQAGLLQSCIAIGVAMNMVLNPTNALFLMPMVNRNMAKNDKIKATVEFQRLLLIVLCLSAMPIILFPNLVLTILYSSRFTGASQYLIYFVIAQCLMLLAGVYSVLIVGFDDLKMNVAISTFGSAILAVLSWLLAPQFGIFGVAAGFLVSGIMVFLLTLAWLTWKHEFSLPGDVKALLVYSVVAWGFAGLIFSAGDAQTTSIVLGKLGSFLVFAAGLFFFMRDREKTILREIVRRFV